MEFTDERVRELLKDAFTAGFLVEHSPQFKSMSRCPLVGAGFDTIQAMLEEQFEAWLLHTGRVGAKEGYALLHSRNPGT